MDRENADIFTKPLGLDKLRQFSGALGLRHLNVPNMRGRKVPQDHEREQERIRSYPDAESDEGRSTLRCTKKVLFLAKKNKSTISTVSTKQFKN